MVRNKISVYLGSWGRQYEGGVPSFCSEEKKRDGGGKQRNGKGADGPKKVVQTNRTKVNIVTGKCLEKG